MISRAQKNKKFYLETLQEYNHIPISIIQSRILILKTKTTF